MAKVVHLTSVHSPGDPRIFHKECKSLVRAGHEVVLVAPHGRDELVDGVQIRALARARGRAERALGTTWAAYRAGLREAGEIYHFHDPELIPAGLLLRVAGKAVVYDVHEDYVTSIAQKGYLPRGLRGPMGRALGAMELVAARAFAVVIAEEYYARRFPGATPVLNYPLARFAGREGLGLPARNRGSRRLLYTGNVTEDRGALLHSRLLASLPDAELHMVGRCAPDLAERLRREAGERAGGLWLEGEGGMVPFQRILGRYAEGGWLAGLALFPPTGHYREKLLTKFFEYMDAGIPIVCSDFPAWREMVQETGCGLAVDPLDGRAAAEAVKRLMASPAAVEAMGRHGQAAVLARYNWESQARRLLALYQTLVV